MTRIFVQKKVLFSLLLLFSVSFLFVELAGCGYKLFEIQVKYSSDRIVVLGQVLIFSPARTATQQGSGKVGRWKINFMSTQKYAFLPLLGAFHFYLYTQSNSPSVPSVLLYSSFWRKGEGGQLHFIFILGLLIAFNKFRP